MTATRIRFELRHGVAHLTLDHPEANAIDRELARELMAATLRCDDDPEVRAVLVTGAGRMFCAGGDLRSFSGVGKELPSHLKEVTTYLHAAISRMARMDAPVVAAVNGPAAGAGMSLACACDLVIAAESAVFNLAYTRAGLAPDGSSTFFLSRHVGLRRALELALTNRTLTAEEAVAWGIATRVVPDGKLVAEAEALARELAAGPTRAYGATKRLLREGTTGTLETQMELESRAIAEMSQTRDGREGVAAFLEKRAPRFTGE